MAAFGPKGSENTNPGTSKPTLTVVDVDSVDVQVENGTPNGQRKNVYVKAASKVTLFSDPMHTPSELFGEKTTGKTTLVPKSDKVAALKEKKELNRGEQKREKDEKKKPKHGAMNANQMAIFLKRSKKQWMSWKGCIWIVLVILQLIGGIISIVLLLPKKPPGGWLEFGPRVTMRVENVPNAVFLAISRVTAYMMYPCIVLVFTSKAHCLRTWTYSTQLRLYLPFFEKLHDVHVRSGWVCFGLTWLHAVFHIIRWIRLECMDHLWGHQTGMTGLIGWICVTVVCLPMGLQCCRRRVKWEYRKFIHTTCGIGFGLAGAFHATATKVAYVYGVVVVVYVLDWFYANLYKTYEVETCHFTRLHNSVVLHWENPEGYNHTQHGYVNICIPFIKRYEWHAISIYPHATKPNCSSLCIAKAGDWSNKLHDDTKWKTTRPVWIQGPFLTPFSASAEYDNVICVSSGSGVSASLAALQSLKSHRRVNFIWLCRDHTMVEFYLKTYEFDDDGYAMVFYTGNHKLSIPNSLQPNVMVFQTRPDLRHIICTIIASIENEDGLPESLIRASEKEEKRMRDYHEELTSVHTETDPVKLFTMLLQRSLNTYTEAEQIKKLEEYEEEEIGMQKFHHLLMKVAPEARFAPEGVKDLAKFFNDGKDCATVNRTRFLDHCKEIMAETSGKSPGKAQALKQKSKTTNGEATQEAGASMASMKSTASAEEVHDRFLTGDGSLDLIDICGAQEDDNVTTRLGRWAVLYCGGSAPVSEALTKVCRDFDISYQQEKFDW